MTPVQNSFFNGINVLKIGTGYDHSAVKDNAGKLFLFGSNYHNQCCVMNFEGKPDQEKVVSPNDVCGFIREQTGLKGDHHILHFKLGCNCTLLWFYGLFFVFLSFLNK